MENWVHHGPITEGFSRWMTTAEYVDGKFYFSYDYPTPNVDEDPFAVHTEVGPSPWHEDRQLLHVGIVGARVKQPVRQV